MGPPRDLVWGEPVKVVASLLPRQVQAEVSGPTHEERVAELVERLAELDATQALLR